MAARGQMTVCRVGFVFVVPDMWEVGGLNRERVQRLRCQLIIYLLHSPSLNTNHLTSHLKHMPRAHTETHAACSMKLGQHATVASHPHVSPLENVTDRAPAGED